MDKKGTVRVAAHGADSPTAKPSLYEQKAAPSGTEDAAAELDRYTASRNAPALAVPGLRTLAEALMKPPKIAVPGAVRAETVRPGSTVDGSWVTVKVCPPMLTVPVRRLTVLSFTATE